jgi:hypothetical protein
MKAAFAPVPGPATAAAGTHRYLSLENEDLRDLNELWDGDSIGNEQTEHIYLLAQMRATQNPTRSYVYHLIEPSTGLTWQTPVTIQTGTGIGNAGGPFTTHIWNFAVSGMNISYGQGARYPVLLATVPDIIVLLHGKNEGNSTAGLGDAHWRGQYLAFTETIRQDLPFADLVCLLQIPNRDDTEMAKKNRVYAQIAAMRGYGVIDLHRLFLSAVKKAGAALSTYMKADGIHPTTVSDAPAPNASLLMAQLELPFWTFSKDTGAIRAQQASALEGTADQLITNGDFSSWTGSLPAGWEQGNATVTKDTRAGYFETVTGNGYAARVQAIDGTSAAYIRFPFDTAFRTKWAGKPITAVVRLRADTKAGTDPFTQGRIGWTDGTQTLNSGNYAYARDGFHYRVLTVTPTPGAAYLRLTIYADTAANASADITVDRVWVVPGVLPRRGSLGMPGPTGAAGVNAGQMDFLSTFGDVPSVAALGTNAGVGVGTANQAIAHPIRPHRNMSISTLRWLTHTASGNYDIGIYDAAGNRLWSKGSTAMASGANTETVSPSVSLTAGTLYYIAVAFDTITGFMRGYSVTDGTVARFLDGTPSSKTVSAGFPLPATVTFGATPANRFHLVTLGEA